MYAEYKEHFPRITLEISLVALEMMSLSLISPFPSKTVEDP